MSKFENNLWAELERDHGPTLVKDVATRRRRNAARWLVAAAAVAVLGTGALFAPSYFGGTPPAYAVVDNPDGSVTLTVRELERFEEATAKLRKRGVRAIAVPLREDCADDHLVERLPMGHRKTPVSLEFPGGVFVLRVKPNEIPANTTLVLAARKEKGGMSGSVAYAPGELPRCIIDFRSPELEIGPIPTMSN
jgi:hypothetical protein